MSIITLHSYRRGVGKTTCMVNLAVIMVQQGYRVGLISQHLLSLWELFDTSELTAADAREIPHIAIPLPEAEHQPLGQLIAVIEHDLNVLDVQHMSQTLATIQQTLELDYLFIELIEPLQSDILSNLALCDVLILMLGLDQTDVQHTAVIADIAHQLGVVATFLLMSQAPPSLTPRMLHDQLQSICPLSRVAILPWVSTIALNHQNIFCLTNPDHDLSDRFRAVVDQILALTATPLGEVKAPANLRPIG
ncbi:MAG: hypothetical protein AAGG51_08280 [Cyanobacteria bacterium P01_G01_bin.54]